MASAFAVEESVMLRMLMIRKFQLTVQNVVQSSDSLLAHMQKAR